MNFCFHPLLTVFSPCFLFPETSFTTQRQTGILSCICVNPAMPDIYAAGSYTKSLGKLFGYQRDGEEWEGACGCSHGFQYLTIHNGAGLCDLSCYSLHSLHIFLHNNLCDHIRNWYQLMLHALHKDTSLTNAYTGMYFSLTTIPCLIWTQSEEILPVSTYCLRKYSTEFSCGGPQWWENNINMQRYSFPYIWHEGV